ncbi:MAG: CDP-diacylglycerol--glycerol-3-phosphate 3-phosphatidyltransferase [Candidatus Jidaibacter sp.]|nr:CDP-diacylglycerol--glycerol-3-phosphate 3-phosphatidyltransferase [Candidatus Jidaibacter sp.]
MKSIPNILTLLRIALIPVLLIALYIDNSYGYWIAAALFAIACLTDYFDGFLARYFNAHSKFGMILDPIADKLLVSSTLMMLVYFERAPIIPAILILCREITVSGLREYLSEFRVSIPVSRLGKIKTALQFIAILILILGEESLNIPFIKLFGELMIWVTAMLTLFTGYAYFKESMNKL